MIIESTSYAGHVLGIFDGSIFKAPNGQEISHIILRWLHFVAGITWIGLLYFFNLVLTPAMKQCDPKLRVKIYPELMPGAMAWFRWSALVTVFVGMRYYAIHLASDAKLAGNPALVGKWFGWSGTVGITNFGAYEYSGPGVAAAGKAALVMTAVGFGVLLLIRWRAAARGGFPFPAMLADVAFAAVLVAVVTSRVLSPQYLVWLLGVAAVCLTRRDTLMRRPAWLVLGAVSVTQLIFPLFYHSLRGGQIYSGLILLGRNGLLVAAAVLAVRALWQATGTSGLLLQQDPGTVRLGQDVGAPLDGEVLGGGAEDRPEPLVHRVGRTGRRRADRLVEGD